MKLQISREAYDDILKEIEELRKSCASPNIKRMDDGLFELIRQARENDIPVSWGKLFGCLKKNNLISYKRPDSLRRIYLKEKALREAENR